MAPFATVESPQGRVSERELRRLTALARAGDRAAFGALLRHYDPRLRALAHRLLGDRERMDDVLQEAYVNAFSALPRFRGEATLGTWLYRIAYNACLDELRRARRAPEAVELPLSAAERRPDPGADPAERAARRGALAAALAALPVGDRATVLLVDGEGLPYARAAEVLGVPEGTVASRLSRARAALRAALGADAEGAP